MQTALKLDVTVVQPTGHINAANAAEFQERLASVLSQHSAALLVDMGQVESLDSAGLIALVSALTQAQQVNKQFGLCNLSPSIRMIFELTQLDRVFQIVENRAAFEQAIAPALV